MMRAPLQSRPMTHRTCAAIIVALTTLFWGCGEDTTPTEDTLAAGEINVEEGPWRLYYGPNFGNADCAAPDGSFDPGCQTQPRPRTPAPSVCDFLAYTQADGVAASVGIFAWETTIVDRGDSDCDAGVGSRYSIAEVRTLANLHGSPIPQRIDVHVVYGSAAMIARRELDSASNLGLTDTFIATVVRNPQGRWVALLTYPIEADSQSNRGVQSMDIEPRVWSHDLSVLNTHEHPDCAERSAAARYWLDAYDAANAACASP